MNRVFRIASREFVMIVTSKAFIFGLLFMPIMIGVVFFFMSNFDEDDFVTRGRIAIIDPTGQVVEELESALTEGTDAFSLAELTRQTSIENIGTDTFEEALGLAPDFDLLVLEPDADQEEAKSWLLEEAPEENRLALAVIHADAVTPSQPGGEYGRYDLYVRQDIDNREEIAVHSALREAIRALRIRSAGLDREALDRLTNVSRVRSVTVTESGEQQTFSGFNVMLPAAFTFLLFMGVMGGGQGLLTSTIEEKSSRVVEVLLSAVSPLQLMAGKLIGHMCVSLVGMTLYLVAGLIVLGSFSMFGLFEPILILYLFVFFIVTYFLVGSLMMAVGAAVNEINEANSLLTPFMLVLMLPWFLWLPISRDPDSGLSIAASFIPPVNAFGMMMRLASNEPPPAWQVWLSAAISVVSVYCAVWVAAKLFRVGLLMFGKPPTFRTLLRWVRDA